MSVEHSAEARLKDKFVVGLTGGIGCGKSVASDFFWHQKIDVVDADIIARDVVEVGSPCLLAIHERFGDDILLENGSLNRQKLREIVFQNEDDKTWLNALLHPAIREKMLCDLVASHSAYVIFCVPLLFENDLDTLCDCSVLIDVSENTQIDRTMARDDSSSEVLVKQIIASQMPREEKRIRANYIVNNEGSIDELHTQLTKLHHDFATQATAISQIK